MKHFFFLLFTLILFENSTAQLSGSYTIGGTSPDFATIQGAVDAMSAGISGPIVFNIRTGSYYAHITFPNFIQGASSINTITFQSETLDSSSVIITSCNNCNIFGDGRYIVFRGLTMLSSFQFILNSMTDTRIENCSIRSTSNYSIGLNNTCVILNSIIEGSVNTFTGPVTFNGNILRGDLDGNAYNTCKNNKVYGTLHAGDCENNEIYGVLDFTGLLCKNNKIYPGLSSPGMLEVWHSYNGQIINNEINVEFNVSFSDGIKVIGNKVNGTTNIGSDNFIVANNFFHGNVGIGVSHYFKFIFNNCSFDSSQWCRMLSCQHTTVENNILPFDFLYDDPYITLSNNDYPQSGGWNDSHPFYIDPYYFSQANLHSTNPQLLGKGIYISSINYDIDSLQRSNPPAIGANEFCPSNDTLNVFCGDSIPLHVCSIPHSGNFRWSPNINMNNIHLSNPIVSTSVSRWYFVNDSTTNYSDSIFVNVIPFHVDCGPNLFIHCGYYTILNSTYNASAIYQWSPSSNLGNPTSSHTIAQPPETTTYIVTADVPGCGVAEDSVTVFVDPLPVAYAQYSFSGLEFNFYNLSTCADNYLWLFGDGDSSTEFEPMHIYDSCGNYFLTLIACNQYGCDTINGNIYACNTGIQTIENHLGLLIFPNPSNDFITITTNEENGELEIYDFLGKRILKKTIRNEKNFMLNISYLANGIYFLKLKTREEIYTSRFIKE